MARLSSALTVVFIKGSFDPAKGGIRIKDIVAQMPSFERSGGSLHFRTDAAANEENRQKKTITEKLQSILEAEGLSSLLDKSTAEWRHGLPFE